MKRSRKTRDDTILWLALTALSAVFAVSFHYGVVENDLFWQIRAGHELLSGGPVQTTDLWSSSARGATWYNFQWLSCVLEALVADLRPGYFLFPTVRALLVFVVSLLMGQVIARATPAGRWRTPVVLFLLLVFVELCGFRLQMRPELYVIILWIGMLALWLSATRLPGTVLASLAILVMWANLHAGTYPFGALFFATAVLLAPRTRGLKLAWRAALAALGPLLWFATPIGLGGTWAFFYVLLHYDQRLSAASDQAPFSTALLFGSGAVLHVLWVAFTIGAVLAWWRQVRTPERKAALALFYRGRSLFLTLAALFTLAALMKVRARPFQVTLLLPVLASALPAWIERLRPRARPAVLIGGATVLVAALAFHFYLAMWSWRTELLSTGLAEGLFPERAARFIESERPEGNLSNPYNFGSYLVNELRDYPVLEDSRELPFVPVFRDRLEADQAHTREAYARFTAKYGLNVAITAPVEARYTPGVGFLDPNELMFPSRDWALVFFDDVAFVYVRRIARHARIIARHEYRRLQHGLPPNFAAITPNLPPSLVAESETELDRCLGESPSTSYCLLGKASFLSEVHHDRSGALVLLEAAARRIREPVLLEQVRRDIGELEKRR